MPNAVTPRILVCASQLDLLAGLRHVLIGGGYTVNGHLLGTPDPEDLHGVDFLILEGTRAFDLALDASKRVRTRLAQRFLPILFLTDDHRPEIRLSALDAGADACLKHPIAAGELLAQMRALLRIKDSHDHMAEKTAEFNRINKRLQQAYQQLDQELELAQRIQTSFLPQTLPTIPRVYFAAHYLLRGRVGGDFYDVFRLDENHVGFYVADAMGHGVPASLLTIFVKKGVKAKEVFGQNYRLVPPGEVLQRLNRELIDQQLSENPFITMAYGLLDHRAGTVQFARAGHPYPLYVPRQGDPVLWRQEGLLLGVFEAHFSERSYHLQPGDKLLVYSDGVDSARFEDHETGSASLVACAARHRDLPIQAFVQALARDLFGSDAQPDDLTLLGIEIGA